VRYVSTRGNAPVLPFDDVLLAGLARDGGLYVPQSWPQFTADDIRALRALSYPELATRVMVPFLGGCIAEDAFADMVSDAYAGFGHDGVAPLKQLARGLWLMELFHGPTLSFKDYALQVVGRLFDHVLGKRGQKITIVGATSGDTGSAAIEACRDRDAIEIFILHPKGRVSDVQRRQMTCVMSDNVHNIAIEGTFDDCQDLVKAMFNDQAYRDRHNLGAVNSINWARIMVQISYYYAAAVALGAPDRETVFAVPTGNFGNVYAGYAARETGLPIRKLVVGSNSNDILTRFLNGGKMSMEPVNPTLSPSMDIQVSSNFERLLFDAYGRDGDALAAVMNDFRRDGTVDFGQDRWQSMLELFEGHRLDDDGTRAAIGRLFKTTGEMLDPHTVVGVSAGERYKERQRCDAEIIAISTAHPAKFPVAVEEVTGVCPPLPPRMADLMERQERLDILPNDLVVVQDYVSGRLEKRGTR
jgi:threonine synthase